MLKTSQPSHAQRGDAPDDDDDSTKESAPRRAQWMLEPPKQEDLTARADPTKLRNRKFNTGVGARAPAKRSDCTSLLWTETPEQKRQRLADEVMGVRKPATEDDSCTRTRKDQSKDDATTKRIQEYNVCHLLTSSCVRRWWGYRTLTSNHRIGIVRSRCTTSVSGRSQRRKKTIPAPDRLTGRRTLQAYARSTTHRRKSSFVVLPILGPASPAAATCDGTMSPRKRMPGPSLDGDPIERWVGG